MSAPRDTRYDRHSPEIRILPVSLVHVAQLFCLGFDFCRRQLLLGHEFGLLPVTPDVVRSPCENDEKLHADAGGKDGGACEMSAIARMWRIYVPLRYLGASSGRKTWLPMIFPAKDLSRSPRCSPRHSPTQ